MQRKTLSVVAIVLVAGALAVLAYVWVQQSDDTNSNIKSFEECVEAGNPVMESSPRQCHDEASGRTHTEATDSQSESAELATRQYKSAKGVTIEIDDWAEGRQISSPLTITGKVPGSWSHEGSFPIDLVYEGDIGLPGTTAELGGDWMTDELVSFAATLSFDEERLEGKDITIVIHNANPSGMPANDDSLALKVQVGS